MGFLGLIWLVLLILIAIWSGSSLKRKNSAGPCPDTAMELLRKRCAKGEIDKEEFEQEKRDLNA